MSSFVISAGSYSLEVGPAVTVTGVVEELPTDTGYQVQIEYYNETVVLNTRPSVENGAISEFPRFE